MATTPNTADTILANTAAAATQIKAAQQFKALQARYVSASAEAAKLRAYLATSAVASAMGTAAAAMLADVNAMFPAT